MAHWLCEEMITGEQYLVCAETWSEACDIAEEVGADFSCGSERVPTVFICHAPLTEDEAEATGLDEY